VDQKFAALVLRDASCSIDRVTLSVMDRCRTTVAGAANSPTPRVRDDMLVLSGHNSTSFLAL
jgi:hypothetical protein